MPARHRTLGGFRAAAVTAGAVLAVWAVGGVLGAPAAAPGGADPATSAARSVSVTSPDTVLDPASGTRVPLPADPVAWLRGHPQVELRFAERFRGGRGGWGTQGDSRIFGADAVLVQYTVRPARRLPAPLDRLARVSTFCAAGRCTTTPGDGVTLAAFVTDPDRAGPVLVQASWPRAAGPRMPPELRTAYRAALTRVLRDAAGG